MAENVQSEPAAATAQAEAPTEVAAPVPAQPSPSWLTRGRMRRRLGYLRSARELGLRDLGGLVFDLHRFERERPDLVKAKLDALAELDAERRRLENVLGERREVDVLREPGLASCAACGALLGSDARFCSNCGKPTAA
jgi:hypothetical protein